MSVHCTLKNDENDKFHVNMFHHNFLNVERQKTKSLSQILSITFRTAGSDFCPRIRDTK